MMLNHSTPCLVLVEPGKLWQHRLDRGLRFRSSVTQVRDNRTHVCFEKLRGRDMVHEPKCLRGPGVESGARST